MVIQRDHRTHTSVKAFGECIYIYIISPHGEQFSDLATPPLAVAPGKNNIRTEHHELKKHSRELPTLEPPQLKAAPLAKLTIGALRPRPAHQSSKPAHQFQFCPAKMRELQVRNLVELSSERVRIAASCRDNREDFEDS